MSRIKNGPLSRREFLVRSGQMAAGALITAGAFETAWSAGKTITLNYAHLGEFVGFDAHRLHAVSFPMFNLLYNSVIVLDPERRPQPELATSWRFSRDGLTLTLNLRRGVRFHSGREVTSEDVRKNIRRIQDPASKANARPLALLVAEMETPDKYTLVLKLAQVSPNIFDLLDLTYVMDPDAFSQLATKGVGTGPFQMNAWREGKPTRFFRFPQYFKSDSPMMDEVIVHVPTDATSMIVGLESGAYDIIERFNAGDAARLKRTSGIVVRDIFAGFIADILINTQRKPFDDKRVRRALNHMVNRQQMIDAAMGGVGEPWCLPFPKNSIAYNGDLAAGCAFDPDKAGQLLAAAGLGGGFSFDLLISTAVLPASPVQARIFQADLARIGVKANIVDVDSAEYFSRHQHKGDYDVAVHQFRGANRDPNTLFLSVIPWYTQGNFSKFASETYTRLVTQAGSTTDVQLRKRLYREISELMLEESFTLCIAPAPSLFAYNERVRGLTWNVEGHPKFERVSLA